jgi:hypothetical protein
MKHLLDQVSASGAWRSHLTVWQGWKELLAARAGQEIGYCWLQL